MGNNIGKDCRALAGLLLERARDAGVTLGCAESCTGGLIAAHITAIPGSSDCFMGGVVSYWAEVKESVLCVDHALIREHGVVSEQCAGAMALGACEVLGCDYAVSTTGIAGPTGAEPGKPVGTVCFGLATPRGIETFTACEGRTRDEVRELAVLRALTALHDSIA